MGDDLKIKVRIDKAGVARTRRALGFGMLNFIQAVEANIKSRAVVHGGNRSFDPDGKTGGTLRRSYHSAAFMDGQRVDGSKTKDENGNELPQYVGNAIPKKGIFAVAGSNSGYGLFVDRGTHNKDGTVKMAARPTIEPAFMEELPHAGDLIASGANTHLRRSTT